MTLRRVKRDRGILVVCGEVAPTNGTSPTAVRLLTMLLAIVIPASLVSLGLGSILPESDDSQLGSRFASGDLRLPSGEKQQRAWSSAQ